MALLFVLLLLLGLLCFIVAAAQSAGPSRLLAAGLAFWVLVRLIQAFQALPS